MGYSFQETNSANKSLSNLDAQGNAKFTAKQDTLVSGENIKTINNISLLGSGDIQIGEGGTIVVDQSYNAASTYAQSGTAVAQAIATRASTSLDNLSSDGQMIINSANGTISNCILEIPQNLKLEISGNTFTIKSGSTITLVGETYTTYTLMNDSIVDYSSILPNVKDGIYYIFSNSSGVVQRSVWISLNHCFSGTPLPDVSNYSNGDIFFETSEKKKWYNNNGTWVNLGGSYPLGLFEVKNHKLSFAKDSNGRDMIFNGVGFIGHHAFIYPNNKALWANGINSDGTLKSGNTVMNSLIIVEMTAGQAYTGYNRCLTIMSTDEQGEGKFNWRAYKEVEDISEVDTRLYFRTYVRKDNIICCGTGGGYQRNPYDVDGTPFVEYSYNGTTVTDFTIRQPYEGARYLLTDEIKEEVATKQADVTTLTGYDATKTQTLKNVNGVLTWVDDE